MSPARLLARAAAGLACVLLLTAPSPRDRAPVDDAVARKLTGFALRGVTVDHAGLHAGETTEARCLEIPAICVSAGAAVVVRVTAGVAPRLESIVPTAPLDAFGITWRAGARLAFGDGSVSGTLAAPVRVGDFWLRESVALRLGPEGVDVESGVLDRPAELMGFTVPAGCSFRREPDGFVGHMRCGTPFDPPYARRLVPGSLSGAPDALCDWTVRRFPLGTRWVGFAAEPFAGYGTTFRRGRVSWAVAGSPVPEGPTAALSTRATTEAPLEIDGVSLPAGAGVGIACGGIQDAYTNGALTIRVRGHLTNHLSVFRRGARNTPEELCGPLLGFQIFLPEFQKTGTGMVTINDAGERCEVVGCN